jgi:hypothetical protein
VKTKYQKSLVKFYSNTGVVAMLIKPERLYERMQVNTGRLDITMQDGVDHARRNQIPMFDVLHSGIHRKGMP